MKNLFPKTINRGLAVLIAIVLAVSGIPVVALAETDNPPDDYKYGTSGVTQNKILGEQDAPEDEPSPDGGEEQESEPDEDTPDSEQPDGEPDEDEPPATPGNTDGDLLLDDSGDDETCVCTAFQSDDDCPVCKDDEAKCFFYYCVCEALCGEDSINTDCPVCNDDYTKCVQAVEVPDLAAMDATWNGGTQGAQTITGTITVTGTVTVTGTLTCSGNVTITGGGKLLRSVGSILISVPAGSSLTLKNITLDGGNIKGESGISVKGTLTIESGTTVEKFDNSQGTGNGAIDLEAYSAVTMNDGKLTNNQSPAQGGAVYINESSIFTMNGGEITNNTLTASANYGGGGIYNKGTCVINDGEISGNNAVGNAGIGTGGAIYNASDATLQITGGIIKNNSASMGEGIFHSSRVAGGKALLELSGSANIQGSIYLDVTTGFRYVVFTSAIANKITLMLPSPQENLIIGQGTGSYALTKSDMQKISIQPAGTWYPKLTDDNTFVLTTTDPGYSSSYYVSYNSNGGSGVVTDSDGYSAGNTVTLKSGDALTKQGSEFGGWLYSGTTYQAGQAFTMPDSDVTFTAVWEDDNPPEPSAIISNVTVDGTAGKNLAANITATIALTNCMFSALSDGTAVYWFTNMPAGITATIAGNVASGASSAAVTFSGVPTSTSTSIMSVTLPSAALSSGADLVVAQNAGAKWNIAPAPAPTYDISLNPSGNKTFDSAVYGYSAQTAHSVTINNTGNQATGTLAVALSGTNADSFTLSKQDINSIAVGGTATDAFTVVPKTGLTFGNYNATVTVSGSNGISASFNVSFAVTQKALGGTVTISGTVQLGQTLTADISGVTPADAWSELTCYWYADGVSVAAGPSYTVQAFGAGKKIKVRVEPSSGNYSGSVTSVETAVVPYTIKLVKSGGTGTDDVYFGTSGTMETYAADGNVSISYVLAGTGTKSNGITYSDASGIAAVTTAGGGTSSYTVNSGDATGGVITITAAFSHADLADVSITETPQTYTYDGNAKSFAITGTPGAGFSVTYNGSGTAPTNAGAYDVAITRGADSDYNAYSKTITNGLVIEPAAITDKPTITINGDGVFKIGATLQANTTGMTPNSGYTYQWNVGGTAVSSATNSTYTVKAADVGKTITVTVTASGNYSGTATSAATAVVPYTIVINGYSNNGDSVAANEVYQNAGTPVTIAYTLTNTHIENKLVLNTGSNTITTITTPASSTFDYFVVAAHAVNGVITITGAFSHSSVLTTVDVSVTAPVKTAIPTTTLSSTPSPYDSSSILWSPAITGGKFLGGETYTATVTLNVATDSGITFDSGFTAKVNGNNANAGSLVIVEPTAVAAGYITFSYTFSATDERAVSSIAVTTGPTKTTYYSGDTLNLAGLVVTATYDDGTTDKVTPDGYKINGTDFTPGSTILKSAQDGEPLTVSYGGKTANTGVLTVYAALSAQITVSKIDSTSAKLAYSATGGSGNLTSKLQAKNGNTWTDVTGAGASSHTASGLSPNTSYEYRIWAKDTTTGRERTESVRFRTAESTPAGVTISGTVTDNGPPPPASITVTIEHGNTVIASAVIDGNGTYAFSFTNIPNGIYNLVSYNGSYKVTQAVTVAGVDVSGINIDMASGKTQSIVDIITDDTPPTAVGGLPKLFDNPEIYDSADEILVGTNGGTVEIKLAVEKKDSPPSKDVALIAECKPSGQDIGLYLDLSVLKSRFDGTGTLIDEPTKIPDLGKDYRITITFELPDDLKGKSNLTIYRVHGNAAQALPFAPAETADGENADISGNLVTLTVCKFSTYAIAYTSSNPPSPPSPPSGNGSSSGGGSGGRTSPKIISTYWIEVPEAKSMAKSAKEQGAEIARSRHATITGIRKASLLLLSESGLRYQHDTVQGKAVQIRVYVDDPAVATKDVLVSGYVTGDAVDKTKAIFGKWYPNKIAVVSFDAQGSFGIKIEVAAKVDLSGMNTSNLYFYSYDKATNKYKRILTEHRIDASGYLHFATTLAGSIIISDSPLSGDAEPQIPGTGGDSDAWNIDDLHNPNTGGDGVGMFVPPTQVQATPQTTITADVTPEAAIVDDGILKLESRVKPVTNSGAGGTIADAVIFNLDAPAEVVNSEEPNVWLFGGIGALVLLIAAAVLWAVIPRTSDVLVQVNERRL